MKVLILANPDSCHTLKWCRALSQEGVEVGLFGLNNVNINPYKEYPKIKLFCGTLSDAFCTSNSGSYSKALYLTALPRLFWTIRSFGPDILHSHFISSYGILGMLSAFRPHVVSIWGSDIFAAPLNSAIHKFFIKVCLKTADRILSTSHVMAHETKKYTNRSVFVTPFGIDLSVFKRKECESLFAPNDIVIGTIKSLESIYGIEYLVMAFHKLKLRNPCLPLKLLIVGSGSMESKIKGLIDELNLASCSILTGAVPFDEISNYHNMLSIKVAVSIQESFGVSVIEAGACERPVIVSNVGGLPEVVRHGVTGFVVPPRDIDAISNAMELLTRDDLLRFRMGKLARERVREKFDWQKNVQQMIGIYNSVLRGRR